MPLLGRRTRPRQTAPILGRVAAECAFVESLGFGSACIMNPTASNRGEAVRYLRKCFPDRLPALLEAFAKDADEELRYQLSEFLRDSDQDAAVGMKIGMLKTASPEKQEVLINEIAELATWSIWKVYTV